MKPKKESGRKILSFLLTFALIVSLVPAMTLTASAAETDDAAVIGQDENLIGQKENEKEPKKVILDPDGAVLYREAAWNETDKKVEYTEKSVA